MKRTDQRGTSNKDPEDEMPAKPVQGRGRGRARGRAAGRGRARGRGRGRGKSSAPAAAFDVEEAPEVEMESNPCSSEDEQPKKKKNRAKRECQDTDSQDSEPSPRTLHYSQKDGNMQVMKKPAARKAAAIKRPAAAPTTVGNQDVAHAEQSMPKKQRASKGQVEDEKKTFAGRRAPATEDALARFVVLRQVFNEDLACHFRFRSAWEARL